MPIKRERRRKVRSDFQMNDLGQEPPSQHMRDDVAVVAVGVDLRERGRGARKG